MTDPASHQGKLAQHNGGGASSRSRAEMAARLFHGRYRWGLVLLGAVAVLVGLPELLSASSLTVAVVVGEFSLVTVGLVALHGYAGQLSLGQAGFMAIAGYTMASLTSRYHWPAVAALAVGIVFCALVAAVMGIALLRMRGLYLALATLAFADIVETVASGASGITGGPSGEAAPTISVGGFAFASPLRQYVLAWALVLLTAVLIRNFSRSPQGRAARAIGRDELMAGSLGVPIVRYKVVLFVVSAVMSGLAGGLYANTLQFLSPDSVGVQLSLQLFVMHVLGGVSSVFGGIIGVAILQWIPQVAPSAQKFQLIISGAVLLVVLRFMPMGLVPGLSHWWHGSRARASVGPDAADMFDVPAGDRQSCISSSPEPSRHAGGVGIASSPRGPDSLVLLQLYEVSKTYDGLRALDQVSCEIPAGCITSVIGPNGAGKTTLLNVITGVAGSDTGRLRFGDKDLTSLLPHEVASVGLARTFQTPRIDAGATVLDNVLAGGCRTGRSSLVAGMLRLPGYRREESELIGRAEELLRRTGLSDWATKPAAQVPLGYQRRLEVARALMQEPVLLILDEPAAGSNDRERQFLAELLLQLRGGGQSVLLVEHNMDLVMTISDHVIVLDQGRVIGQGTPPEVQRATSVIEAYLGHGRATVESPAISPVGDGPHA